MSECESSEEKSRDDWLRDTPAQGLHYSYKQRIFWGDIFKSHILVGSFLNRGSLPSCVYLALVNMSFKLAEDNALSMGLRSDAVSQFRNPFTRSGSSHKNNDLLKNPAISSLATSRLSMARYFLLLQLSTTITASLAASPAANVEDSPVDSFICHNVRVLRISRSNVNSRYIDNRKEGEDDFVCSTSDVTHTRIAAKNVSVADGIEALVLTWPKKQYSTRRASWDEA